MRINKEKGFSDVDEDLPDFFDAVRLSQADELVKEEYNMIQNFGLQLNDPATINELDITRIPEKSIQGTPWYQVTSNDKYKELFNYFGAFIEEREKLIEEGYEDMLDNDGNFRKDCIRWRCEQSDLVMILLNLAYIPKEVIEMLTFKAGWQEDFKSIMKIHKNKWGIKLGRKWRWMDEESIRAYARFKYS